MPDVTSARLERAPWLDLLRIMAATAVFAFHWLYLLPNAGILPLHVGAAVEAVASYGYLGVEVFFIVSGYVISLSAEGRTRQAFARARFLRLWPAFVVCAFLTVLVRWWDGRAVDLLAVAGNLTMLPRLLGQPYLDDVYWSLMFEILFYAYVFLFLLGPAFVSRLLIFSFFWLGLALANRFVPVPGATLMILDYAPYFVVGIAIYLIRSQRRLIDCVLGLAGLGVAVVVTAQQAAVVGAPFAVRPEPLIAAAIVAICAVAIFIAARAKSGARLARLSLMLGGMSYPLYLVHNEIGATLARWVWPLGAPSAVGMAAVVLVLSYAVWRLEAPIRVLIKQSWPNEDRFRYELARLRSRR